MEIKSNSQAHNQQETQVIIGLASLEFNRLPVTESDPDFYIYTYIYIRETERVRQRNALPREDGNPSVHIALVAGLLHRPLLQLLSRHGGRARGRRRVRVRQQPPEHVHHLGGPQWRQPAGRRLRQRPPAARPDAPKDRGAGAPGRAPLRHQPHAPGLQRLREQDPQPLLRDGQHKAARHRRQQATRRHQ